MSQIVYIGSFAFPLGDAVAKRVLGVGMALKNVGYKVSFIGEDKDIPLYHVSEEREYNGYRYCCLHKPQTSREHLDFKKDIAIIRGLLQKWNEEETIYAVFFCGMKCAYMAKKIIDICKELNIKTYADSMDWLKIHTGNLLFDIVKQADIEYELKYVNMRADGVLAISSFLSNFYEKKGKKTIVVPPLSPYEKCETSTINENKVPVIVYAGVPCRLGKELKNPHSAKDRLDVAIELLNQLYEMGTSFVFEIYGLTQKDYLNVFPKQEESVLEMVETGALIFKGFSSEMKVREAVKNADYTILLREKNRTSMAGFPTKIAESITLGTPVITTDTSDICKYITDEYNGLILDIEDKDGSVRKIKKYLRMSNEERRNMRQAVVTTSSFAPMEYINSLKLFLE